MTDILLLEGALDRMHAALLTADFNELPDIIAETEKLLAGMQGLPASAAARLRDKAHRNGQCLEAAARGLRSSQRRLQEVTGAMTKLSVYSSHGRRSDLETGPSSLTQRL